MAQGVYTAVNVGVIMLVILTDSINDSHWALCRGGVVQVCESAAVNLLMEYGEVCADAFYIKHTLRSG
jgi:hypothetical protein